jgi:hypothetical protein
MAVAGFAQLLCVIDNQCARSVISYPASRLKTVHYLKEARTLKMLKYENWVAENADLEKGCGGERISHADVLG